MRSHLQWILISGIIIFFILVLLFLKRKELSLKYTLLWLLAGSVMAVMVISPSVLIVLSKLLGIETPMYTLFVIGMGFILCILMALTSIVSRQNQKITKLIQTIGMLEKRIRDLESNFRSSLLFHFYYCG